MGPKTPWNLAFPQMQKSRLPDSTVVPSHLARSRNNLDQGSPPVSGALDREERGLRKNSPASKPHYPAIQGVGSTVSQELFAWEVLFTLELALSPGG